MIDGEPFDLIHRKCLPLAEGTHRLKQPEIDDLCKQLNPGWKVVDGRYLEKEYAFPNFKKALEFTNEVGSLAEQENHHPDIYLAWGKAKITIWTHTIHGLSENDFILAAKCDLLFTRYDTQKPF